MACDHVDRRDRMRDLEIPSRLRPKHTQLMEGLIQAAKTSVAPAEVPSGSVLSIPASLLNLLNWDFHRSLGRMAMLTFQQGELGFSKGDKETVDTM